MNFESARLRVHGLVTMEEYRQAMVRDLQKAKRIVQKLERVARALISNPLLWGGVVELGWTRMLKTSDFPVIADRVLQHGFAPHEWFLKIPKASRVLAASIAERWWHNHDKSLLTVRESLGIPAGEPEELPDIGTIERIKRVVKWDDALNSVDEAEVKTLGFLWLADHLIALAKISYDEGEVPIQKRAWELLEELLGISPETIVYKMEEITETLANIEVASWDEIVRLPW